MSAVASVEPSSTTTQSTTGRLCARTLSIASRTKPAALCAGMIAPTLGRVSGSATSQFSPDDDLSATSAVHLLPLARGPAGAHAGGGVPEWPRGSGSYGSPADLRPAPRRVQAARARGEAGGARRRLALAALPHAALAARDGIRRPGRRRRRGADRQAPPPRCGACPQSRAARHRPGGAPPYGLPADL